MRCIELSGITSAACAKLSMYGTIWKVMDERRDKFYFKSKTPHLYIIPFEPNPTHRNLGAMWISEYNDMDYDYVDVAPPRIRRAS